MGEGYSPTEETFAPNRKRLVDRADAFELCAPARSLYRKKQIIGGEGGIRTLGSSGAILMDTYRC